MFALKFMHDSGIVHRDLTLYNLVLEKDYNRSEICSEETNLIIIGNFDAFDITIENALIGKMAEILFLFSF